MSDSSLSAEEEAEYREHWIDGSGAFTDGSQIRRLLATLDAERAASAARIAVLEGALRDAIETIVHRPTLESSRERHTLLTNLRAALRSPATEAPTLVPNYAGEGTLYANPDGSATLASRSEPIAKTGERNDPS